MSLPACPMCGEDNLPIVDAAAIVRPGKPGSPLKLSVTRLRTYRCPACDMTYRTSETIDTVKPEVMWVRKLAENIRPTG